MQLSTEGVVISIALTLLMGNQILIFFFRNSIKQVKSIKVERQTFLSYQVLTCFLLMQSLFKFCRSILRISHEMIDDIILHFPHKI